MLRTSNFVNGKVMDGLVFKVGTEILIRNVMSCGYGNRMMTGEQTVSTAACLELLATG